MVVFSIRDTEDIDQFVMTARFISGLNIGGKPDPTLCTGVIRNAGPPGDWSEISDDADVGNEPVGRSSRGRFLLSRHWPSTTLRQATKTWNSRMFVFLPARSAAQASFQFLQCTLVFILAHLGDVKEFPLHCW